MMESREEPVIEAGAVSQEKKVTVATTVMSDICLLSGTGRTGRDYWKGRGSG